MQISAKCSTCENGLSYLDSVGPNSGLGAHQAGENRAAAKCPAAGTGQRYLREERRLGDADFGVRGNQHLLSFTNIGPSLEQCGRQACRYIGRNCLLCKRASTQHALRVLANENADGIFLLANLSLEVRDLSICGVEHLLSLQHIQLCGDAVIHSERSEFDGILLGLHGVAGDLELEIEVQKREIIAGHVADEREHDGALRILSGQELGTRRFGLFAQLAEEVQLEGGVSRERKEI